MIREYLKIVGGRILHEHLREAKIARHYEEFDGDHSSVGYRLDVSLPWLYEKIIPGGKSSGSSEINRETAAGSLAANQANSTEFRSSASSKTRFVAIDSRSPRWTSIRISARRSRTAFAIPTIFFFECGQVWDQRQGARPKADLEAAIKKLLQRQTLEMIGPPGPPPKSLATRSMLSLPADSRPEQPNADAKRLLARSNAPMLRP